jgi:hypothetical protein
MAVKVSLKIVPESSLRQERVRCAMLLQASPVLQQANPTLLPGNKIPSGSAALLFC